MAWSNIHDFVVTSPTGPIWVSKRLYTPQQRIPIVGEFPHDKVEVACHALYSANHAILEYIQKRKEEANRQRADMQKELELLVPKKGKTDAENARIYEITHMTFPNQTGLPADQIDKMNEAILNINKLLNSTKT